jgi:hypothetical protein
MSAVASTETLHVSAAVAPHEASHGPSASIEAQEQKRWMLWFGVPIAVAAVFLGLTFGTGQMWYLALAIGTFVFDIGVLVWLAMSSDTNGIIGAPVSHH